MLCRHCHRVPSNRPRGLCWTCYHKPGVRDLYPSTSKHAREGLGLGHGRAPLDKEPTRHRPGTCGKLDVLCDRARRRVALFHPEDAR